MISYILRRMGQSAVTVLLVTMIIFLIIRLIGDPTHLMLPPEATEADRELLAKVTREAVLPKWSARCSAQCVKDFNATIGKTLGLTASK